MELWWVALSGVVGLAVGSFLNVLILRLPAGESVVRPRSRCPYCGEPLAWIHNLPVVSWIALRGACARCGASISVQYPLVEAATAALWAGNAALLGPTPEAARAILLTTLLLAIAVTDARFYVIPDELSLGGTAAGVLVAGLAGWVAPAAAPVTAPDTLHAVGLAESVIGAVVGSGILWIVAIVGTWAFGKDAMGGGDIKMMAMIGAFLGWKGALLTIFLGALAGTLVFVPIAWKTDRLVPFGLFLALGAGLTYYLGEPVLEWYLGFYR